MKGLVSCKLESCIQYLKGISPIFIKYAPKQIINS